MKTNFINYLYLLTLGALTLGGCKKEVEGLGSEPGKAKIIFVNVAPNAATDSAQAAREIAIYPYYNGTTFNNSPIKVFFSNGYKAFAPGPMTIRLEAAQSQGTLPPGPSQKVAETTFPIVADTYYSLYAVGTVNTPTQNVEPFLLTDDLSLPTPGKAKVRIMNFSPNAGPIDVVITGTGAQTLATSLTYKGVKDFFEIDPGIYTMEARVPGTTTRIGNAKPNMVIDANSCYSIWVAGFRTLPSPKVSTYNFTLSYHANRWSNPLVK